MKDKDLIEKGCKSDRIFSGENSCKLWDEVNSLTALSTGDDVRDVLYSLGCALQKLEARIERLMEASNGR